ncbi:lasso peptide biosynthesis B2 protein [Novosphingobium aquae]|uniref:lasso peptide biosynthesis B2 protein n=1 Tax=Novosphingobium aquae TaxID=3133435 RepID=UPI003A9434C5
MRLRRYSLAELFLVLVSARALFEAYLRLRFTGTRRIRIWSTFLGSGRFSSHELLIAFNRVASRSSATCLVRALALQHMLARNGHESELRIGVARAGSKLQAHAWLIDKSGEVLVGGGEEADSFKVISYWTGGLPR